MPAGRPPNPDTFTVDRLYRELNLYGFDRPRDRTGERMPELVPDPRLRCPVTGQKCRAPGCSTRACSLDRHLGRLTQAAVRGLLQPYANLGPNSTRDVLRRSVRDVLNNREVGALFRQDLIEASLDASGGEEGLHVRQRPPGPWAPPKRGYHQ